MNEKTCKSLRRLAQLQTVGMPERRLIFTGRDIWHATARNDPQTTRGVYRAMKRQLKKQRAQSAD